MQRPGDHGTSADTTGRQGLSPAVPVFALPLPKTWSDIVSPSRAQAPPPPPATSSPTPCAASSRDERIGRPATTTKKGKGRAKAQQKRVKWTK
ncbi:hypothetical protein PF010_g12185 [Phytophthora fragariae]|uniref:Uncharacterized protein n=1 Tax=Phytophthora fragariae TaxID=53985 RepID=A0A6A3K2E7_9STRA|nr:hypothetical protein PF011_g13606 [Phytophthora fragariae]KAE9107685.1 hypothetical protein PF010_g12185 [Phytophthora fragariae]KAE9204905.1 hypothetical protein PF004_g17706 [Phytophthora fragariae]